MTRLGQMILDGFISVKDAAIRLGITENELEDFLNKSN